LALPLELLSHAVKLLSVELPSDVELRRAVSSLYYALFHQINQDAAALLAPNVSAATNFCIQRWFDHRQMKEICGRFTAPELANPLLGLIGRTASSDLRTVTRAFILLQEARHQADYDLGYQLAKTDAISRAKVAAEAFQAWQRIQDSSEVNIFILSLLMWENWKKERT
jgi:hypothetical protein